MCKFVSVTRCCSSARILRRGGFKQFDSTSLNYQLLSAEFRLLPCRNPKENKSTSTILRASSWKGFCPFSQLQVEGSAYFQEFSPMRQQLPDKIASQHKINDNCMQSTLCLKSSYLVGIAIFWSAGECMIPVNTPQHGFT